jgi:hypothetical protein
MSMTHTILNLATDYRLWGEYVDSAALDTEEAFNNMTVEEKVKTCIDCFLTGDEHLDAQRPIIVEVPHQTPARVIETSHETHEECLDGLYWSMPDGWRWDLVSKEDLAEWEMEDPCPEEQTVEISWGCGVPSELHPLSKVPVSRDEHVLEAHGHDLSGFAVYDNLADAITGEASRTHQGDKVRYQLHLLCGDEVTA